MENDYEGLGLLSINWWDDIKKMLKKQPSEEMDKCVFCNKDTEYSKDIHIDERLHYIEGAGQLCKECYDKIYNKDKL